MEIYAITLRNATNPYWATWPVILAILIGPPNWVVSPLPLNNEKIKFKEVFKPELFSYFFQSSIVDLQIKESSKQSTVTNLHLDKIRELLLIKPPISEQQQIVEYLDEQTKLIDNLMEQSKKQIDRLKEYRSALISAAVTGKIDVRNMV